MRLIFIIFINLLSLNCFAQPDKQSNIWYFGESAGLDFSNGSPTVLTNGQIVSQFGGSSVLSDENGQLLLYSDGISIWNKNHQVIQGGDNIGGGNLYHSANGLIIPHPKYKNQYYVFSIPDGNGTGTVDILYTFVNLSFNTGNGGTLSTKNILKSNVARTMAVMRHCNNKDFWLVLHEVKSNNFLSYLIDDSGIVSTPIISSIGSTNDGSSSAGLLGNSAFIKPSLDSKLIALALNAGSRANFVEVFDFDNKTGKLTKLKYAQTWHNLPTSILNDLVFTENNKFLYVSRTYSVLDPPTNTNYFSQLFQLDLSKDPTSDASMTLLATRKFVIDPPLLSEGPRLKSIGGLQLGLDKKIYVSYNLKQTLSRINNPNLYGTYCDFQIDALDLQNRNAGWTFPTLLPPKIPDPKVIINLKPNPNNCNDILTSKTVGLDSTLNLKYQWYLDGVPIKNEIDSTLIILKSGKYYLKVEELNGCQKAQSDESIFTVRNIILPPIINQISPICAGGKLSEIKADGTSIKWYNDVKLKKFIANNQTLNTYIDVNFPQRNYYFATQTDVNNCESPPDSVEIIINANPKFDFNSKKTSICLKDLANFAELSVNSSEQLNYVWTFKKKIIGTSQTLQANNYGTYFVIGTNQQNCTTKDSVEVVDGCFQLYIPSAFSPNNDLQNDKFIIAGTGIATFDFYIYNRWGELILSSKKNKFINNYAEVWDGKINEKAMDNGLYSYIIDAEIEGHSDLRIITQKGDFLLVR